MTTHRRSTTLWGAATAIGMDPQRAESFAQGRAGTPEPTSLYASARSRGMTAGRAATFARGRAGLHEAAKDAAGLGASAYAYAPDLEDPTTWLLQLTRDSDNGAPAVDLVKWGGRPPAGIAGYEQAVDIPASALPDVRARLRSAWITAGIDLDQMPPEPSRAALEAAFRGLGLSPKAATAAARGRSSS